MLQRLDGSAPRALTPSSQYVDALSWSPDGREIAYSAAPRTGFTAAYDARIYAVNPTDIKMIRKWEGTLYSDAEAAVSACGTQISVGPTAEIVSGLAVWAMMQWFGFVCETGEFPDFETLVGLRPFAIMTSAA